jgi:hypothetical protein
LAGCWRVWPPAWGVEMAPNPVLPWLGEAAAPRQGFAASCLCDLPIHQWQLDELSAVWRGVKEGERSAKNASKRLERSRHWVGTASDPESQLLLASAVGPRSLAMAQRVGHPVGPTLGPSCVPLWLTDRERDYTMAVLSHCGFGHQPSRQRAQGPAPQPRWLPWPALLSAPVVHSTRRWAPGRGQASGGFRDA